MKKIESVNDLFQFSSLKEIYDFFPSSKLAKGRIFEFFCKHLLEGSGVINGDIGSVSSFYWDDNGIDILYPKLNIAVQCKNWRKNITDSYIKKFINRIKNSTTSNPIKKICIIVSRQYSSVNFSYYKNCKEQEVLLIDDVGITALMKEINPRFKKNSNIPDEQLEKAKNVITQFFSSSFSYKKTSFSYKKSLKNYSLQKEKKYSSPKIQYIFSSFLRNKSTNNKIIKILTSGVLGVFILSTFFYVQDSPLLFKASIFDSLSQEQTKQQIIEKESRVLPFEIIGISNNTNLNIFSTFFQKKKKITSTHNIEVNKIFDLVIVSKNNKFIGGSPVFPSQKKVIITPETTAVSFLYIYSKSKMSHFSPEKIKEILEKGISHKKFSKLVKLTKKNYNYSWSNDINLQISLLAEEIIKDVISF